MNRIKFTVLVEDSLSTSKKDSGLEAKHGLSILVETSKPNISILMDTGPSSNILLRNMEILGVRLKNIDTILLSHCHYDHTGGLLGTLKEMKRDIPVIAHPHIFSLNFKIAPNLKYIGSSFKLLELKSFGGIFLLAKNSVRIADGVVTTGEIERITPYEKPQGFWTVENEKFIEDEMWDDQALILNLEDKGLIIVSGCAHAGIINTIKQAQKLMGIKKVHAVIGGFHLSDSKEETINATINDLTEINPSFIYPCHCTGSKAVRRFIVSFKGRCNPLRTGDTFKV
jgi:7,8-dihydropterin-6-yl-methyl-4-(beta-D-ribofuranosyl)aminobenzene 5'-phosphate synthase